MPLGPFSVYVSVYVTTLPAFNQSTQLESSRRTRSLRNRQSLSWHSGACLARTLVDATACGRVSGAYARRCNGIGRSISSVRASLPRHAGACLVRTRVDATAYCGLSRAYARRCHMGRWRIPWKRASFAFERHPCPAREPSLCASMPSLSFNRGVRFPLNRKPMTRKSPLPQRQGRVRCARGPPVSTSRASTSRERRFRIRVEHEALRRMGLSLPRPRDPPRGMRRSPHTNATHQARRWATDRRGRRGGR